MSCVSPRPFAFPKRDKFHVSVNARRRRCRGSNGHAGVGLGIEAAASANGLAFVPLAIEHVDLITFRRDAFEPPLANAAGVYAHA